MSPDDFMKILISLLRNDGKLLKPETLETMYMPQVPNVRDLLDMLSDESLGPMLSGGLPEVKSWNFGLGGLLNTDDVDGVCRKGTMSWCGLPSLFCEYHSNIC
jgi:hypothetical protein